MRAALILLAQKGRGPGAQGEEQKCVCDFCFLVVRGNMRAHIKYTLYRGATPARPTPSPKHAVHILNTLSTMESHLYPPRLPNPSSCELTSGVIESAGQCPQHLSPLKYPPLNTCIGDSALGPAHLTPLCPAHFGFTLNFSRVQSSNYPVLVKIAGS